MALLQKTPGVLLLFLLGGALFGGLLGETLLFFSPTGFVKQVFVQNYQIGLVTPITLDLFLITATVGFTLRVNLMILLGILLGLYTYKQV